MTTPDIVAFLAMRSHTINWLTALVSLVAPGPGDTASDRLNLRDGTYILGQVVEPAPRGKLLVVVRREWAKANAAERLRAWESAEKPWIARARTERLKRLRAWRGQRGAGGENDRLGRWIDSEIALLEKPIETNATPPLMLALISRGEVRSVVRQPPEKARLLRMGWRAGFNDVEEMKLADLQNALEGRGFSLTGTNSAPIDDLFPIPTEDETTWLARRAATEVLNEAGARFVRYQGLLLPDSGGANAPDLNQALPGLINSLLGGPTEDPLPEKLRGLEKKGRVGAIVTQLDLGLDSDAVRVDSTLWVRAGRDRWQPMARKSASVRGNQLGPDDGQPLGDDPQVQAVFKMIEGLGLGEIDPNLKRRSLNAGAATQKALGMARTALDDELQRLALPIDRASNAGP